MSASIEALKNPNIFSLWMGQMLSQMGTRMYLIALSWWIVQNNDTSAGIKMGILLVIGSLPAILFVKTIGLLLDSKSTRKLLISADLAAFLVSAVACIVTLKRDLSLAEIYVLAFFLALFQAIVDPAINKAVPQVISSSHETEAAVGVLASSNSLASFGGALIGASAIGLLGLNGALWINALSYLIAAAFSLNLRFGPLTVQNADTIQEQTSGLQLRGLLRNLLISFGFINFFATPIFVILPLYVKNTLGKGANTLALMEAALWLGFVVGAFASEKITTARRHILVGGVGIFVTGGAIFFSGIVPAVSVYLTLLFTAGLAMSIANVKFISLFQGVVPDCNKGQFFSRLTAYTSFTFPIAFLLFGFLADLMQPTQLALLQGAGVMGLALWYFFVAPREGELWT